jgi:ABC-type dipeptide/oligopeptide/nickel transport system permease subunit
MLEAWRRFRCNRPALLGSLMLLAIIVAGLLAPLVIPDDLLRQQLSRALIAPSWAHPLGTDHLGRDVLARLLYGARLSLMIGVLAMGLALVISVPIGIASGYFGGAVDLISQRIVDILLALPGILPALVLGALLGPGLTNVVISVGIGIAPLFIRLARGATLRIRAQPYVEAARALGVRNYGVIVRHVLPNIASLIIVQAALTVAATIPAAAGLGFLGLGVPPTIPEWGAMLGEGRQYIFSAPHLALAPGIAIFLAAMGFNLLGDGLRAALDPAGGEGVKG